jgi:hypothetical protein
VVEIVEQLDLCSLKVSFAGRGSQPYNPEMLVALLFYGYATGVFSSRELERNTYDSVAFRYIAANSHPDHDTIATFRRRFLPCGYFLKIIFFKGKQTMCLIKAIHHIQMLHFKRYYSNAFYVKYLDRLVDNSYSHIDPSKSSPFLCLISAVTDSGSEGKNESLFCLTLKMQK